MSILGKHPRDDNTPFERKTREEFNDITFNRNIRNFRRFVKTHNRPPKYGETKPCLRKYFISERTKRQMNKMPLDILKFTSPQHKYTGSTYKCRVKKIRKFIRNHGRLPIYGETSPCLRSYFRIIATRQNIPDDIFNLIQTSSRKKTKPKKQTNIRETPPDIQSFVKEFLQKSD